MELRELNKKTTNTVSAAEREKIVKESRAKDDKMIKGMFEFLDAQGGFLEFTYRKYPSESIKIIKLIHGEICDLPMGIVRHLNNTKKKVRRYDLTLPMEGGKVPRSYESISRVKFTPLEIY